MPLSSAEKMRRYRQRLKTEQPEKYEEQRKKNLERIKSRKKKVSVMSTEEKEVQRQNWRRYQIVCRKKKKEQQEEKEVILNKPQSTNVDSEKLIKRLRTKCRMLGNKCRRDLNYMNGIIKLKEKYKKRFQRIKAESTKKINMLEETIMKMKAREEVLEHTLKSTYSNLKKHNEKRLFKKLIYNTNNKNYMANLLGLKYMHIKRKKTSRDRVKLEEIRTFYLRDDVSRNTAGRKQTKTRHKNKQQIRYLLDSLVNLYRKYKSEGGRFGFTTFFKQKPFFVLSPHINSRDTCMCIKHSNFNYLFVALKHRGILKHRTVSELLDQLVCSTESYSCMYSNCEKCAMRELDISDSYETDKNKMVTWYQWERIDHTYLKKNGIEEQLVKTKKTTKSAITGPIEDLLKALKKCLNLFKIHHYNMLMQSKEYQKLVQTLNDNEAVIVCDFSENFECKLSEEIQSMHFGASKAQVTLHTGMIYWKNVSQSFCSISDSNNHQPAAIWAHLTPILNMIKENTPGVNIIHFFSDGPTSQYRQKNNFYLLIYFKKKYNWQLSTWSFFESGHGKSVADGIGGCVKRLMDKKICYGSDITNATDAYNILKSTVKNIKVFLIKEENVKEIAEILPRGLIPLKGTMNLHQVITTNSLNTIKFRDVSCFCEPLRGDCSCFSSQNHTILHPIYNNNKENRSLPSSSKMNDSCRIHQYKHIKIPLKEEQQDKKTVESIINNLEYDQTKTDCYGSLENMSTTRIIDDDVIARNDSRNEREIDLMNIELLPLVILSDETPNHGNKPNITIKGANNDNSISTNTLRECHKCSCSILGKVIKCLACKNLYCDDCIEGPTYFDYICDACFDED